MRLGAVLAVGPVGTHPSRLSLMNAHLSPFISSSTVSPTPIAGAVLTPGSGGGGGAPGSPPSSVMFVGVSAAAVESLGAWDVPGSNPAADVTRGGAARSALVAALPTGGQRLSHSVALAPSAAGHEPVKTRDVSFCRAFQKARAAVPPPRCPRLTPGRTRGATPSTSSATRARAGSRREGDGRQGGNAKDEPCQREEVEEEEAVEEVGTAVEPTRPASPTPAAPRALHRTRRRDSRVARAELLEMEREARALREDDARVRDTHENDKNPNPPPRVHDREPARCRVPRYPPQLPRSLEVVPTIFVLEAKARREEEEVMEEEERVAAEYARKTIKHEEERRERERAPTRRGVGQGQVRRRVVAGEGRRARDGTREGGGGTRASGGGGGGGGEGGAGKPRKDPNASERFRRREVPMRGSFPTSRRLEDDAARRVSARLEAIDAYLDAI